MNNDLISRSALKEEMNKLAIPIYGKMVLKAIDNAPAVEGRLMTEKELDERDSDAFETGYIKGVCEQRPQGEWGKWVISEIHCPECLEYFVPDCYSAEELNKCPNCGAKMKGGEE